MTPLHSIELHAKQVVHTSSYHFCSTRAALSPGHQYRAVEQAAPGIVNICAKFTSTGSSGRCGQEQKVQETFVDLLGTLSTY